MHVITMLFIRAVTTLPTVNGTELGRSKIINVGGGIENSMSCIIGRCEKRFGPNKIISSCESRPMDALELMDSTVARNTWNWSVKTKLEHILNEGTDHAEKSNWLSLTINI